VTQLNVGPFFLISLIESVSFLNTLCDLNYYIKKKKTLAPILDETISSTLDTVMPKKAISIRLQDPIL
jgi:hypothetical protein